MSETITYRSTTADDRFETSLVVHPDGSALLQIGSNRADRTSPIGRFEATLPPSVQQPLLGAFGQAFAASPSQNTLVPDETLREIGVGDGGSRIVKRVGEQLDAPPAFASAERAIVRVIEYVRKFPVVAISGALAGVPSQVQAGGAGFIDLALRNDGRVKLQIPAPALWGQSGVQAELMALRSDVPTASLGIAHQQFVQLDASRLAGIAPPAQPGNLQLAPAAFLTLRFRDPFDWPPGRYNAEASITLRLLGPAGETLFTGSLVTPQRPLEVLRRP